MYRRMGVVLVHDALNADMDALRTKGFEVASKVKVEAPSIP
jgi:hypothetical protein